MAYNNQTINFGLVLKVTFISAIFSLVPVWTQAEEAGGKKVYKWVDEKGKVHFSDKPPKSSKTQTLEIKSDKKTATDTRPTSDLTTQQRVNRANKWMASQKQMQQQKQREQAKKEAALNRAKKQCQRMRDDLSQYERSRAIYDLDKDGKRVYLNEQEFNQVLTNLRNLIKKNCQ
ncbi:MAG: DUF4124 domain-containing protein [Kangiellaceae bacterium]|jgi:hypothetical protein|nr:DUF4124 domain-containing protein [Kangiellaceae bacterium]